MSLRSPLCPIDIILDCHAQPHIFDCAEQQDYHCIVEENNQWNECDETPCPNRYNGVPVATDISSEAFSNSHPPSPNDFMNNAGGQAQQQAAAPAAQQQAGKN